MDSYELWLKEKLCVFWTTLLWNVEIYPDFKDGFHFSLWHFSAEKSVFRVKAPYPLIGLLSWVSPDYRFVASDSDSAYFMIIKQIVIQRHKTIPSLTIFDIVIGRPRLLRDIQKNLNIIGWGIDIFTFLGSVRERLYSRLDILTLYSKLSHLFLGEVGGGENKSINKLQKAWSEGWQINLTSSVWQVSVCTGSSITWGFIV